MVLLALTCAVKIRGFRSSCKAQYVISASCMEKMETQELKWLFQNCRASEVKSGTEFRFLCSYLYQAVQEEGSSWVSKSCWATYSLGKKKVSSWVTSTGFCSTLLFIFDFSCRYQSDSHLPSWGLFAEVAKLQKKLLLSFTEASTILAIRKAHQIQITIESPNMYAVIPQINVYRGNVLSCSHPTHEVFLIAEEVPELMERKADDCSWVARALSTPKEGRQRSLYHHNN